MLILVIMGRASKLGRTHQIFSFNKLKYYFHNLNIVNKI